ncbi:MAG: DNA methyltransferase [Nanoarchaeota archaeon]|nr:DNA methyltransferase [Nanoarchaeota archaeon]
MAYEKKVKKSHVEKSLTKSKFRIRDHGEVFTPDFIVNDMLNLVKHETERIDSRFLESACGDGNFLIKILERKLEMVEKKYKKNQFDYEINSLIAISSIYGIELLDDNVEEAQKRLYNLFLKEYKRIYKNKINQLFLENIKYVLGKNLVQGNALIFKDKNGKSIIFPEWSAINGTQIQRRDFIFEELFEPKDGTLSSFDKKLTSDNGESVFIPKSINLYPPISFLKLMKQENV